jgi:hypothetical protein
VHPLPDEERACALERLVLGDERSETRREFVVADRLEEVGRTLAVDRSDDTLGGLAARHVRGSHQTHLSGVVSTAKRTPSPPDGVDVSPPPV